MRHKVPEDLKDIYSYLKLLSESLPELRNCDCCKHDKIKEIELKFLSEEISGEEAARILNVGSSKFKKHIELHLKGDIQGELSANAPILAKKIFDKTNQLIESCDRMLSLLKDVEEEWKSKKKSEWITAAVKLEQVLTTNIEKLAKIQGEAHSAGTLKIEQLNVQVNNMTKDIIENMCPMCKERIAPKILNTLKLDKVYAPSGETKASV